MPVIVLKNETERPEAVEAGTARLAGIQGSEIVRQARLILDDASERDKLRNAANPYGDGEAAPRIAEAVVRGIQGACAPDLAET